ncbi:MAG: hypothetical protein Q9187_005675 [Circinaria calcarea]
MRASSQLLFLRPSALFENPIVIRPCIHTSQTPQRRQPPLSRSFVTNPLSPTLQTLHAARTLPYPASSLYTLIADIASYPSFLPYCTSSTITAWSNASFSGRKYPAEAELRVGWSGYDEAFKSKVFCVPETVVEAVAGQARTTIPDSDLHHYRKGAREETVPGNELFESLLTRWTLREFPFKPLPPDGKIPQVGNASLPSRARTEVNLTIEVKFASAVYAALSQAAAPKVAGVLIEAFEKRVKEVLGEGEVGPGERMGAEEHSALEGSIRQD